MALPIKYNLRNLIVRKSSTFATAFTVGLTVGVYLLVAALAQGIDATLASSGEPMNLIVVREGSTAELNSSVSKENLRNISFLDGVAREGDQPMIAPEQITLIYKPRKGMTQGSNIMVRGIGPMSTKLRSGFQLVSGRMFKPGLFEAIVSRRIAERFQGMGLGDKFRVQTTEFEVVGIFEAGGKAFESESWADINALSNATKRDDSTSVLLRVTDPSAMGSLARRISDDQRLHLKAMPEIKFYEDQQGMASGLLKGLAVFIAFIMAIGAAFAGMNTMYAAVARRTKEIGTLRVLGFSRRSILVSFVLEAIAISVLGAAIGIVLALPLNFVSTGTANFVTFSEIAFNFRVTPSLMLGALIFGGVIGFIGSLLPAIRAARFKIVDALRAV